jgi:rsbT co-antagonist protein RsbR
MDRHSDRPVSDEESESAHEHQGERGSERKGERQPAADPERDRDEQPQPRPSDNDRERRTEDQLAQGSEQDESLLRELVAYLRDHRTELREGWARRIGEAKLLQVMSEEEVFSEATEVYDNYVDALETGSVEALEAYARELSERIIPRGVQTDEVLGIVLLLRDLLARSLFAQYQRDSELLNRVLDAYEPAANRIAVTVGVSFVEERERVINEQQEALRELSTPVLQLRERLLILPIIGVLDSARARQLTEQLLAAIQENRARVVVIDITGVASIDRTVANHLVQTVEASRLMGASTILTGLSPEIAQTIVDLGVDLSMMRTVGDLQGGLVEAERLAGYRSDDGDDLPGLET